MSPTCYAADSHRGEYGLGTVLSVCVLVFVLGAPAFGAPHNTRARGGAAGRGRAAWRYIRVCYDGVTVQRATVSVRDVLCSCDRGF